MMVLSLLWVSEVCMCVHTCACTHIMAHTFDQVSMIILFSMSVVYLNSSIACAILMELEKQLLFLYALTWYSYLLLMTRAEEVNALEHLINTLHLP